MKIPRNEDGRPGDHPGPPATTHMITATAKAQHPKGSDDHRLRRYHDRAGWYGDIPEGHYAIVDPHDPTLVTMWRVKACRLQPWPREARNGPEVRALRRDIPRDRVAAEAFWAPKRAARAAYLAEVEQVLTGDPERAAARYAAVTFRCAVCNRRLEVPESNAYGVGPECRSWMPADMLAEYARQVALVRAEHAGGAA